MLFGSAALSGYLALKVDVLAGLGVLAGGSLDEAICTR